MAGTLLAITGLTIVAGTTSASAATGKTGTITITPDTGLTNGQTITITGSGFTAGSIGNILECNSDSAQPNVMVGGLVNSSISVSCNAPSLTKLVTTTSTGTISGTFNVVEGTVGPPCVTTSPPSTTAPCPATDTAGNSPAADAALYPCPPTAAQLAKGDTCTITYGDEANDSGVGNISFASQAPAPTPTTAPPATTPTTKAPTATTPTTKAPTVTPTTVAPVTGASGGTTPPAPTATAPSTLATTGPGRGVGWLSAVGVVLLLLGLVLLFVLLEGPRRALAVLDVPTRMRRLSLPLHRHPDRSTTRQVVREASRWSGHIDHLGRRLGDQVSGAPAAARTLTHKVISASSRTAAWLLGR